MNRGSALALGRVISRHFGNSEQIVMESFSSPNVTPFASHFASRDVGNRIDLTRRVVDCLREAVPQIQGALHVTAIGSTVTIRGELPTERAKQLCLDCCRRVPGVLRLVDELIVDARLPAGNDADEWLL